MAKTVFETVDDYIASHPPATQRVLQQVRAAVRRGVPKADEVISYGIAGYRIHGYVAMHFAGWKQHYSFYPAGAKLVAAFKEDLAPYEVNNKGTVRFPLSEPVPTRLIAKIAKFRANEVAEVAAARAKKKVVKKKSVRKAAAAKRR